MGILSLRFSVKVLCLVGPGILVFFASPHCSQLRASLFTFRCLQPPGPAVLLQALCRAAVHPDQVYARAAQVLQRDFTNFQFVYTNLNFIAKNRNCKQFYLVVVDKPTTVGGE